MCPDQARSGGAHHKYSVVKDLVAGQGLAFHVFMFKSVRFCLVSGKIDIFAGAVGLAKVGISVQKCSVLFGGSGLRLRLFIDIWFCGRLCGLAEEVFQRLC